MGIIKQKVLPHNFAIWVLGKKPGFFKPQRYIYRCVRCKWAFVINDDFRGQVRVAHENGVEIDPEEALRRLATFKSGPCQGFVSSAVRPVATPIRQIPFNHCELRHRREA